MGYIIIPLIFPHPSKRPVRPCRDKGGGVGHTLVQTTARYAHLAADPVKAVAERVTSNTASILGSGQDQDADVVVI